MRHDRQGQETRKPCIESQKLPRRAPVESARPAALGYGHGAGKRTNGPQWLQDEAWTMQPRHQQQLHPAAGATIIS